MSVTSLILVGILVQRKKYALQSMKFWVMVCMQVYTLFFFLYMTFSKVVLSTPAKNYIMVGIRVMLSICIYTNLYYIFRKAMKRQKNKQKFLCCYKVMFTASQLLNVYFVFKLQREVVKQAHQMADKDPDEIRKIHA